MPAMVGTYAVFSAPRTGKPKAWYAADRHEVHVYRTKREAIAHADAMHTPETVDWLWHGKDLHREIGVAKRIVDHRSNAPAEARCKASPPAGCSTGGQHGND